MELEALRPSVFCGIDWAEDHHDVALVDAGGAVLARLRIGDDAAGYTRLLTLLAAHGDTTGRPVPVGDLRTAFPGERRPQALARRAGTFEQTKCAMVLRDQQF